MRFYYSANPVLTADKNKAKVKSLKSVRVSLLLSILVSIGLLAANKILFSDPVKPISSPMTSENEENLVPASSSLFFGPGMPPTIDGNFCDSVEWGAPIGIDTTDDTPTNTADVVKLWHKRFGDTLYFAWLRFATGAGTSSFNLLFDRDCDGVEDFLIELPWGAIGSNCTEALTISATGPPVSGYGTCNGGNSNSTELTTPALQGSNTCPITVVCNDIPGRGLFAEYYILLSDLVDLCLINPCDCSCGKITLGNGGSFAGGSFNSALKDSFNILSPRGLTIKTNSCPVASFTKSADNICLGSMVNFDGTMSIDTFPLYDSIRYQWNFGDGSPTSMLSMPTHQYNTPGTYNVLLTISDTFGCIDTQAMNIIVFRDTTPPSITCPNDTSILCLLDLPLPNLNSITAFDNCSPTNAIIKSFLKDSVNITDSFCINHKVIHRIYQAIDSSGNRARCIQKITIRDTIAPIIICPNDTLVTCTALVPAVNTSLVSATDNCLGIVRISHLKDSVSAVDSICLNKKIIYRIYQGRDTCMNTSRCIQRITVRDTIAPIIICPNDTLVACTALIPAVNTSLVSGTDNCLGIVRISHLKDSVSAVDSICLNKMIIYRIYYGLDTCMNTSRCIQKITVRDTIAPMIICPNDTLVTCTALVPAVNTSLVSGTDNCLGIIRISHLKDSVSAVDSTCLNKKIIYRIYQGRDTCMNTSRCIQRITVRDTIAPIIICPNDTLVTCTALVPAVNTSLVSGMDNCLGVVRISHLKDSVSSQDSSCLNNKIIYRIYLGRDTCMNTSLCIQRITVRDTIAPMIICPNDTLVLCTALVPAANTSLVSGTDNCLGIVRISHLKDSVSSLDSTCLNNKIIYRIYQGRDTCVNSYRCIQKITVRDTVVPQLICPADTLISCVDQIPTVDIGLVIGPDNCGGTVRIIHLKDSVPASDSTCVNGKIIYRIYEGRDTCTNSSRCIQRITVRDTIAPMLHCPDTIFINCREEVPGAYNILDSFIENGGTVEDNCCIDTSSFELISEISENLGVLTLITRSYVIMDCCGLSDTCTQILLLTPCNIDLALIKTTDRLVVSAGEVTEFKITIFNQGDEIVEDIKVTDYVPNDFEFDASNIPAWDDTGLPKACRIIVGQLAPGEDTTISIFLKVKAFPANLPEGLYNFAEITSANDIFGQPIVDIDSNWDNDPDNDTGGNLFNDDDNNISGNSFLGEDEDDHDGAYVIICGGYICNDQVTVSLDADCEYLVTGDDVLEHPTLPAIHYRVTIKDASGKEVPNATFTRAHIGYCFTYSVDAPLCPPNSCWGRICVEDKFPPAVDCAPDTVLCFELSNLPEETTVLDNCSGTVKVQVVSEQFIDFGCDSVLFQGVVKRRLIATDTWKNTMNCEKLYYVRRLNIEDLVCPRDTSIDCSLRVVNGIAFTNPIRSGAPTIEGIPLWPNNVSCKLLVNYQDERSEICGGGYKIFRTWTILDWCGRQDTMCTQIIKIEDKTAPVAGNRVLPQMKADPHDCRALVRLDTLVVSDCGRVTQTYSYPYLDEATGIIKIADGTLPASVWVTYGLTVINVTLTDECFNRTERTITVNLVDVTPPTPVCKEYTQVTVDPVSCWTVVKAKDLDNGSHDNCIGQLHFAVARMADIEKARTDYIEKIETECGIKEYRDHKAWYDKYIEVWINCYVFDDELHMDDCGDNQVVLRVYEADSMPRLDPHVWPCGEHEWFCYNTYPEFRLVHNYHFFSSNSPSKKDCEAGGPWLCKSASQAWYAEKTSFAFTRYYGTNNGVNFPQTRLYNDCMVWVIVDDKQAPVVDHLEDITVYCDHAPGGNAYARQLCKHGEEIENWPGTLVSQGKVHGYYGGSNHIKRDHTDHNQVLYGCDDGDQWSPIYCRNWLFLDNTDQTDNLDPAQYFYTLVKIDKDRPSRPLGSREFSVTDNCRLDDTTMHYTDFGSVNQCGEGWYQRTWWIKDKCGNEVKAVQKVIVKHRSDFEVIFPQDLDVTCDTQNATDTSQTGKPIISDDECELVGVLYVDEISAVSDGACYKIIRTWTLIDWCNFEPNIHTIHPDVIVDDRLRANTTDRACVFRNLKDNGDGYMKYIQIIKVYDSSAPVITCRDSTFCIVDGCSANVNIPLQAMDNCAGNVLLRLEIARPDGRTELRTGVTAITGSFSAGVYHVTIIGKDNCNNEDTCNMTLTFNDCKAPTPYCLNGVATVVMPSTGTIEIWAKDLDRGSSDNCTPNSELRFSFSSNTSNASRVFRCSDILNGKQQAIEVQIWVTDAKGNQDLCKTYILLQDNAGAGGQPGGVCKDTTIAVANINGRLYTEDKEGVEFATVEVKGLTGPAGIPAFKTTSDGNYAFNSVQMVGDYSLKALRDDNPMNGVSTLDMILIQKHILGTEKLKSPYKMIAADVNNSDDINVQDLIELRKLILGIYEKLPTNTSWKFIPKSHQFVDVQNPWGYPTEDKLMYIHDNTLPMVRDFVGVKIGDVNSSAIPHSLMGVEVRGNDIGLMLEVENRLVKKGEMINISFRSPNFRGISGWQGTMNFDTRVNFIGLKQREGRLQMSDQHLGKRWVDQGMITMSWNNPLQGATAIDIDEAETLFTMVFLANETIWLSEALRIGSQYTRAESYEGKGEFGNLSLRFVEQNGKEVEGKNELYQNYPNPFDQRTVIGIRLAEEGKGTLKIYDVTGRTIKSIEKYWGRGYHEVWVDRKDIKATGVLNYRFESTFFMASKKMIVLD